MAVTVSTVLNGGGVPSGSTNTTASWTPDGTSQAVLTVSSYISTGSTPAVISGISGNGLTWTKITNVSGDNTGADRTSQEMWVAPAGGSGGTITITWSTVPTKATWVLDKVAGASSSFGSGSLPQAAATGTSSGANPSATLGSSLTSGSVTYASACFESSAGTLSAGTGYTALGQNTSQSFTWSFSEWNSSGSTTAAANNSTVTNRHSIILIEIAVSTGGNATATPAVVSAVAAIPGPNLGLPGHISDPSTGVPVEPEAHSNDPAYYLNGALYRVMESSLASGNHPMMMKSSNGGGTWAQVSSLATGADLEAVTTAVKNDGHTLSVTICPDSSVWYYEFDTSSDTWTIDKETVDSGLSSSGVAQCCYQVQLSDGTHWIFYSDTLSGANQQLAYRKRTGTNTYGTKVSGAFATTSVNHGNAKACVGASDLTYVFYDDDTNAHVYMRTLSSSGTLSSATQVDVAGAYAPSHYLCRDVKTRPVYYDDAGVEVISVMWAEATTGNLYLTQFRNGSIQTRQQISTGAPVYNAASTTSDAIAAHIAVSGTTIHMIWADNSTGDILYRARSQDGTLSATQTLWNSPSTDAGYYVFCEPFTRSGQPFLGFVYDKGEHLNDVSYVDYNEIPLPVPAVAVAAVAAVPAPNVRFIPSAVVVGTTAVPAPSVTTGGGSATATPAVVSAVAAVAAPTIQLSVAITPAAVVGIAAAPAPTVQLGVAITPAAVVGVTAVPAPTAQAGSVPAPAAAVAVTAVPAPVVQASETVASASVARVVVIPSPSVSAGGNALVLPAAVVGTTAISAPAVLASEMASPAVVIAVAIAPVPTVQAGSAPAPAAVVGVAAVPTPSVSVTGGATPTPSAVARSVVIPAPTVQAGQTVSATVIARSVVIAAPTISLSVTTLVSATVAIATVPAPLVVSSAPVPGTASAAVGAVPVATAATAGVATAVTGSMSVPTATGG